MELWERTDGIPESNHQQQQKKKKWGGFFSIFLCLTPSPSAEAQKLPYYASYGPARLAIHTLCTSHYLDLVITFIICINVITMSLEHYSQPQVGGWVDGCVGGWVGGGPAALAHLRTFL